MKKILILSVLGFLCLLLANAKNAQTDINQFITLENIEAIAENESDIELPCWEEKHLVFEPGYKIISCEICAYAEDSKPISPDTGKSSCTSD